MPSIRHLRAVTVCISSLAVILSLAGCGGGENPPASESAAATPPVPAAAAGQSAGEQLYQRCVTCHQANGEGMPNTFPPLVGSEFANAANPSVPIRILIRGIQGPLTVKGAQYNGVMPPYGVGIDMTDQEVADVLTYVRQSWGNNASPITPQQVAAERAAAQAASGAVTAEELKRLMGGS